MPGLDSSHMGKNITKIFNVYQSGDNHDRADQSQSSPPPTSIKQQKSSPTLQGCHSFHFPRSAFTSDSPAPKMLRQTSRPTEQATKYCGQDSGRAATELPAQDSETGQSIWRNLYNLISPGAYPIKRHASRGKTK
jgi:hypothetical protein